MTSIAVGNRRLLRLAAILDKADALHKKRGQPGYYQESFRHHCGTPACALGHYAANSKRWVFRGKKTDFNGGTVNLKHRRLNAISSGVEEFAIAPNEWVELFSFEGCGNARTAKQAARYIRQFVARRQKAVK